MRASWKGYLTVNLVAFQVEAFNTLESGRGEHHFHQLHAPDHKRIHYAKVCPTHGEVPNKEIVSGYEYKKGKYVEIEPEELDVLRTRRERSLALDAFVAPDEVDLVYLDGRTYYLGPVGAQSQEAYVLLRDAMKQTNRVGIGQVVFAGRDQLAMVRPADHILVMELLNWPEQIRSVDFIKLKRQKAASKSAKLAKALVEAATDKHFDFQEYHDRYQERITELINAKVKGKKVVAPEEEEEPEVVNLIDALRKSVGRMKGAKRGASRSRPKARHKAS